MNRKTLRLTDLENTKDNCILFSYKFNFETKYLAKDRGKFKIWTTRIDIEKTARDKETALMYYNNTNKFFKR